MLLTKKFLLPLLTIAFLFPFNSDLLSQENSDLKKEVVVIGTLIPTEFSKTTRHITILTREDIMQLPVSSVSELMKYIPGIDMRERGPNGIQGDLSIRGSNFSQVVIMINGVKISDPQTAHHNMDIPVSLGEIERIEVLHGQGSSVYGKNAFSGAINIITRESDKNTAFGKLSYGEHQTAGANISFTQTAENFRYTTALDYTRSDGFEFNRDFDIINIMASSQWNQALGTFKLLAGYNKKDFGANNFYGPYPSKEWTRTGFFSLKGELKNIRINTFYRRHSDRFLLDINRPEWYVNTHITQTYGIDIHTLYTLREKNRVILGSEIQKDTIKSDGLGEHTNTNISLYSEYEASFTERFYLNLGFRSDFFSGYPAQFNPNVSLALILSPKLKIRGSAGRAFRIPSFTELYYSSPANIGNPKLKPEKNLSFEAGFDYFPLNTLTWEMTFFLRQDRDLIDWTKQNIQDPWKVQNIHKALFFGVDARLQWGSHFSLGYNYIRSRVKQIPDLYTKYVFNHPVHHISSAIVFDLPFLVKTGLFSTYKKRRFGKGYLVLDIKLSKRYKQWEFFMKITNLLDIDYEEIPGISMPGRWITAGFRFDLD